MPQPAVIFSRTFRNQLENSFSVAIATPSSTGKLNFLRTKRQLWSYIGFGIETHSSADQHSIDGKLQRAAGSYTFTKLNSDLWFELLVVRDGYSPASVKANDSSYGMAPTAIPNL